MTVAPPTHAGLADFLGGCLAEIADLQRLPATLAAAGAVEVDPAHGPQGPAVAQAEHGRRLWSATRRGGAEAFTGFTAAQPGRPLEVCWHVSRPGDTAAQALTALKRRFPPEPGFSETGTEFFYGGFERWRARVGTTQVTLGVSWALEGQPNVGVALLHVAKQRQQRDARQ